MKKNFKDNPALAFISATQENAQQETQQTTQGDAQQETQVMTHDNLQLSRPGYVRTQGRKGHKKPRINLAFDSEELLENIRKQAEKEEKSITQLMNEAIIIYLNNLK